LWGLISFAGVKLEVVLVGSEVHSDYGVGFSGFKKNCWLNVSDCFVIWSSYALDVNKSLCI
jgi:hypothetical protein